MIPEAMPLITDPEVAEEAQAFVRQEGQHSMAHRQHAKGLIKSYPALKETLDEVIAAFDDMTANKPLKYRLAYTADLEATFTPVFKLMLDNDDTLFAPGDDRVASLFLWHFVEEVEHRSSALIIYDAVVDDPWYRMRVAPSIFKHVMDVIRGSPAKGFNKHVPLERAQGRRHVDVRHATAQEGAAATTSVRRCAVRRPVRKRVQAICRCASSSSPCRGSCAARSPATTRPTRSCPPWPTSGSGATTPATTSPTGTPQPTHRIA